MLNKAIQATSSRLEKLGNSNDPDLKTKWANLAIRNGLLLLTAIFLFRAEKLLQFHVQLEPANWIFVFLPDVGTVLLLEAIFLGFIFAFGVPKTKTWPMAFYGIHALLYVVGVVEHQFLLKTGTQIDIGLMAYSAQHGKELAGVIGSGLDGSLLLRIIIACSCFGIGFASEPHRVLSLRTIPKFLFCALVLGPVFLWFAQPAGGTGPPFSTNVLVEFFLPFNKGNRVSIGRHVIPEKLYQAPQILSHETSRRPNIVLLILESTRASAVPPYNEGIQSAKTPFFSKIAREGVVFDSVYTTVPHTSKALVGMFCGMYPRLTQPIVESTSYPFPLRCLPELLGELGYRSKFMQTASGEFENRPGLLKNVGFHSWLLQEDFQNDFKKLGYFGMDEFAMIDPAIDWVKSSPETPFFLTLLTVTTHHPYQTPTMDAWPKRGEEYEAYLKAIEHLDEFSNTFFRKLQKLGNTDNTLFIIMGDHGEAFGEHYRLQHDVVPYEEGIHVPLYMFGPSWLGPARKVNGLRQHIDLLPTILDILGSQWEGQLPGKSLLGTTGHEFVMSSCWYTEYCLALRKDIWKFIYHFGRKTPEVFQLEGDPGETDNLIKMISPDLGQAAWQQMHSRKSSIDYFYNQISPTEGVLVKSDIK